MAPPRRVCPQRWRTAEAGGALSLILLLAAAPLPAQQQQPPPVLRPRPPLSEPAPPPGGGAEGASQDSPPPGDWAPELLDGILNASNPDAQEALYDAAFAAGPDLIPQLQAALKDDRTAEFAAQSLAFLGGEQATKTLEALVSDPRDLDLRRFYLGALGEFPAPEITQLLVRAVEKSDLEPDRTVTEAAVWALTVRSDPALAAQLRQAEAHIQDLVIREAVDNAGEVIEARAKYLASPDGKKAGSSIPEAVRTYFIGALENPVSPAARRTSGSTESPARTEVNRLIFSPDGTRALAHVTFVDPDGTANYDLVLQKQYGDWAVVSVWMGSTTPAPEPVPPLKPATPSKSPARPKAPVRAKPSN
ncbi:MAG TPA: HEAT repeat domain-containing protein [Terriglobia bacterium]|nr:HEAT repeat domain-containing protein [Terriglobia bacterium]